MTVIQRHPVDRPSISQEFANVSDRGIHLGIDYRPDYPGQTNFPVYAAHDGFVVFARGTAHAAGNAWEQIPGNGNNGNSIIIQAVAPHQACATSYNHMGTIAVQEGQWVTAGTFLGYMGWTGFVLPPNPAGTHLHFELFIDYGNGQYPEGTSYGRVNPLEYFAVATTIPIAPGASGGGSTTRTPNPEEWDEMATKEEIRAVVREELVSNRIEQAKAVWAGAGSWIRNRVNGKREYAETALGSIEDRVGRQQVIPLRAEVAGLTELVSQLQTGQAIDYARIEESQRRVLREETVTVDIDINGQEQP